MGGGGAKRRGHDLKGGGGGGSITYYGDQCKVWYLTIVKSACMCGRIVLVIPFYFGLIKKKHEAISYVHVGTMYIALVGMPLSSCRNHMS